MLIALVLTYLFLGRSGGAADFGHFYNNQARSLVKAAVSDPVRKKSAVESAESAKKAIEALAKQMEKNGKQMRKLYEDYSSQPEQWDRAIQSGIDVEKQPFNDFVGSRKSLLKSVTPQEWNAIIADAKRENEAAAAKAAEKSAKKIAKEAAKS